MSMKKMLVLIWAAVASFTFATHANAAVLTATSQITYASDFVINFDDADNDGLFDIDELITFSGVTYSGVSSSVDGTYTTLWGAPDVANVSSFARLSTFCVDVSSYWCFGTATTPRYETFSPAWAYRVDLTSPVPVPAALSLLASGLGALGVIGWRRKRKQAQA